MALSDINIDPKDVDKAQTLIEKQRMQHERDAIAAAARVSLVGTELIDGTSYEYRVVDGNTVCITGCTTQSKELSIPKTIMDMPVVEIDDAALSELSVEAIVCSPFITTIGKGAFRRCKSLRHLVFPQDCPVYDASWCQQCPKLEVLELPGKLERIERSIFANGNLKQLIIGPNVQTIDIGAFENSNLSSVKISSDNPYLSTDGSAIITKDGKRLIVFAVRATTYRVPDGVETIARRAFAGRRELAEITLPDTLSDIDEFAFSKTTLVHLRMPASLRRIHNRAFYNCKKLADVKLNEGLECIEDCAFAMTALNELRIPSTLKEYGRSVTLKTKVTYSGPDATFTIAGLDSILLIDRAGGLYRNTNDELTFVRLIEENTTDYTVRMGTVRIEDEAFAKHPNLEIVELPEGLEEIGARAFKDCRKLRRADFPKSLRKVKIEAFLNTSLESVCLPAHFEKLGPNAIVTYGAHHGDVEPSLKEIKVDPACKNYYYTGGLLIERKDNGKDEVVAYDGSPIVTFPPAVNKVTEYALNGARSIEELYIGTNVKMVATCALKFDCFIRHIHIDIDPPVDGYDHVDLEFPDTERSVHEISNAFGTPGFLDVGGIMKHYDTSISNMHDFQKAQDAEFDQYDQALRIIDRLEHPLYLGKFGRGLFDSILKESIVEICVAIARHDDRDSIDSLLKLGYLTEGNLLEVIDRVGVLQDAAMTGHLLELRRKYFKDDILDFSL